MQLILPLAYFMLGASLNLKNYDTGDSLRIKRVFNGRDFVQNQVNALNSTYYVLPDNKIPYKVLGVPIDLIVGVENEKYHDALIDRTQRPRRLFNGLEDTASILFITNYRTFDRSLKENATPIPGWQKRVPEGYTHYVDKMHFGSNAVSFIAIRSNVTGDVQVFRKILKDIMGTSGSVGESTVDLWKEVVKTIKESDEVKGSWYSIVSIDSASHLSNDFSINPSEVELIKYLIEYPKYVSSDDRETALYVTLKSLHDLDERYPALKKNMTSERYIFQLKDIDDDLEDTHIYLQFVVPRIPEDDRKKFDSLLANVNSLRQEVKDLMKNDLSIYKEVDSPAFNHAKVIPIFEKYQSGLVNSTGSYFAEFKRIKEQIAKCGNDFYRPVRGSLVVEENELIRKEVDGGLSRCQELCVKDDRCRAIGYNENVNGCLIYYRSTNSARIIFPKGNSTGIKVYDRKCL